MRSSSSPLTFGGAAYITEQTINADDELIMS